MPKAVALIGASAAVVLAIAAGASGALRAGPGLTRVDSGPSFVPGEVVVRYRPGADRAARAAVVNSIDAHRKQFLLVPRAELLDLPAGLPVDSAVQALEARSDVQTTSVQLASARSALLSCASASATSASRAWALQQAQITLLQNPRYADPFFWASFLLINNWL